MAVQVVVAQVPLLVELALQDKEVMAALGHLELVKAVFLEVAVVVLVVQEEMALVTQLLLE
jgi:hypothetical protein